MYHGRAKTLFVKYAIPQMIGLLFNSVYIIVDGIFIGNRLGTDAMAAAAVSVPLVEFLIALSIAVSAGAGVLISGHIGRGEREEALNVFNTTVRFALVLGLLAAVLGNLFIHPLAEMLGATPQIHTEAVRYMRYIVSLSPFLIFSFLFSGLARNDGRPELAMAALVLGSISNIVLDYVFMYPLNMGVGGAALATALGPIFSVLILFPHFILKKGTLFFANMPVYPSIIQRVCTLGLPSFVMEFTIGIITFVYNAAIVRCGYGETGLAAYLIIGYLMLIILTVFLGLAEGLQPVFSYFSGTEETERSDRLCRFAVRIFLAAGIMCYLLVILFSRPFFRIFNPADVALIDFAREKSLYYFWGFFLAGCNILMIAFWQSTGKTSRALIVSLSRSMIFPPVLTAVLPAILGREIIWFCHSAAEGLTSGIVLFLFLIYRYKDPAMRQR